MLVELQCFVEFASGKDWKTREGLVFETMTINTEYICWFKRWSYAHHDFCEVHFSDRGQTFTLDISYEDMKRLLGMPDRTPGTFPGLAQQDALREQSA